MIIFIQFKTPLRLRWLESQLRHLSHIGMLPRARGRRASAGFDKR